MDSTHNFFRKKHAWSKYKDLILDYYLEPYLRKVATLKKPIVIVDCFAGPGKFGDGELGSPLIISKKIADFHSRGIPVKALFVEADPALYGELQNNLKSATIVPAQIRFGNFQDYMKEIFDLAKTHTTFIYIDPFKPTQFLFEDMASIYDQLYRGQSVEILINFMSTNFLRIIWAAENNIVSQGIIKIQHPQVLSLNKIAGGTYWQKIAFDRNLSKKEQVDRVADEYAKQLNKWFEWTLTYPIREKYHHKFPKYHLVFGSRHPDAIDLMNRAMVKARREFVGAWFVKGHLFENQPAKEIVNLDDVENLLMKVSRKFGRTSWQLLRVQATVTDPGKYTDSEFNKAIKTAIQRGRLKSNCNGAKTEQNAHIWFLS